MLGLEDALRTPLDDGSRWRLRVAMAVDHAAARVVEHVVASEGSDSLLAQVRTDSPRLGWRVDRLRTDHSRLLGDVEQLRAAVADLGDDQVADRGPDIQDQARALTNTLTRHRHRRTDLVYEAYQVDLGGDH
ncbi:MAG: hypothetical protein AAGE88_00120 [Actinomycetota bacterium]